MLFICFLFFVATTGTLSRRFARGCSLSLGGIFETSLLAEAGVETSERALRERIVWRGERFPVGVPPRSSPNCGRGEVSINSLAPFFSLFLFVYSGRGRQPTYIHEEKKRGEGVP